MKIVEGWKLNFRRAVKPHDARRKWLVGYASVCVLLFVVLTFVRFFFFGDAHYWSGLVDKMSAAVVLALIAALMLAIVVPPISFAEDLSVVDAWNIGPKLREPLTKTREYWFRGRSGRWFRAQAIPTLAKAARDENAQRMVHMILPDPDDSRVLETYAKYRNSISSSANDRWTASRIRSEIFATLLAAGMAQSGTQYFRPEVSLLTEFSLFRTDLSDEGLVMTREDPRWPGWISGSGTKFYDSVKEDLRLAKERGRVINLSAAQWPPRNVTRNDVPALLTQLGFAAFLTPDECKAVADAMKDKVGPYE